MACKWYSPRSLWFNFSSIECRYIGCCSISSVLSGAWYFLMWSLLAKASMSLLRVSSYGRCGRVEQKFKPFCIKLVSDWVSFNEDKVTILLLRISAFLILSLFFFFYSFSFIRSPFPFQSIATNGILPPVPWCVSSLHWLLWNGRRPLSC